MIAPRAREHAPERCEPHPASGRRRDQKRRARDRRDHEQLLDTDRQAEAHEGQRDRELARPLGGEGLQDKEHAGCLEPDTEHVGPHLEGKAAVNRGRRGEA